MWLTRINLQTRIGLMPALVLALSLAFMIWEGVKALQTTTEMILQERLKLGRTAALHLDHELQRTIDRLAQVAAFPTINLEDGDMGPEKAELRDLFRPQVFSYVFLLNKDGLVLWTEPYMDELVGRKGLECPHFQEAIRTGQPGIACVAHTLTPKNPMIAPMVPILNKKGIVVGLLGGAIDPSSPAFAKVLHLHDIAPGQTGYLQIVDEKGVALTHTQDRKLFQKSEHVELFASLIREKKPNIATHMVTEEGKGTFREVIAFAPLTVAPWGVAIEQKEAELFAPVQALRQKILIFAFAIMSFSIVLVWLISQSVVGPVRKLLAASGRIASGDLTTPIPTLGQDEIGKLGRSFEEMRKKLARWGDELETKVKERTKALQNSYRFLEIANRQKEMTPLLKEFAAELRNSTGCAAVGIRLLDEAGNIPYQAYEGFSEEFYEKESPLSIKSDQCMCTNVVKGTTDSALPFYTAGGSFYINTTTRFLATISEEDKGRTRNECNRAGYESVALVPIPMGKRILGLMHIADRCENMVPLETVENLERVAMQLGEAIERLQTEEKIQRRNRELSVLYAIQRSASRSLNLEEILNDAVEVTLNTMGIEAGGIFLLEPDGEMLTFQAYRGVSDEFVQNVQHVKLGEGISGRAAAEKKPVVLDVPDYPTERLAPFILKEGFKTLASTPLLAGGELVGALNLGTRRVRAFPPEEIELLTAIGQQLGLAIQNARLYKNVQQELIERKRAEESLRETRGYLENLLNYANAPMIVWNPEFRIILFNHAFERLTGYATDQIVGQELRVLFPEASRNESLIEINRTLKGEYWESVEIPILCKDGGIRIALWNSANIYTEDGKTLLATIAQGQDITGRKRAEEAVRESEGRYRSLVETARDVIFTVSPDRIIITLNSAFETITGWSQVDWIGKPFNPLVHPDDLPLANERFQRCLREEKNLPYELRILCKSGVYKIGEFEVTPLVQDRRVIRVLGIVRDITERKRAEQEMAVLQEQFHQSQKMEAVGRLAGGIAHDFNNLLTVIKGYSQLSSMELNEGDPLKVNIEEIQRAANRAADLTRQLLAFSRRQVMEMKVLDLNTILRDLEKMLHRVLGEDIELVTFLAEGLGRVKADRGQIEQVIMNLAVNSRDAMPSGGKLTVETANVELDEDYARNHVAVTPGRYVMLSVSDTGVGMTPEVRERVFEPFFTTKEKDKGTGLGLSTVYGIAKQSGGNIWVYSEPGQGTTFKIYLPRADEPLQEVREKVVKEELPHGGETILVVEDEEKVRKLTVEVLMRHGYRVLEAANGPKALLICESNKGPINLILTDVVMPAMSGRELTKKLLLLHPEMKVLYMSGYADNAIVHHGVLEEGMNFIQKPFTIDGLTRKVREILG